MYVCMYLYICVYVLEDADYDILVTKAPREELRSLPHRVSLGLSGGGCGGGGWVGKIGFFGYPPSGAGKNPVAKGACFGPDFGPFGWLLDVQRKNRPPLMLLMLAWACRLMLLMLVVSWPRCACVSSILALGVLQHVCLSMFGEKLVCWVKTCFTWRSLCLARS